MKIGSQNVVYYAAVLCMGIGIVKEFVMRGFVFCITSDAAVFSRSFLCTQFAVFLLRLGIVCHRLLDNP